ncbi:hypothetical protein AMATHDRAFT_4932 [Amanita thiersii Skay4041]|uniref:Cyclopropane-fatty-acyl-phospholipid synthase n=1 Tax=Amanita thiersii Skay4041 TaxID=703135 RepID=A0A2A9NNU6_9AGAR|nr:hypothetical protein AMATHDRAFT_4932 [Amanita thiersii Skay4041]
MSLKSTLFQLSTKYAKSSVIYALQQGIIKGHLTILDIEDKFTFGERANEHIHRKTAFIQVNDEAFWLRVYLSNDLGFAEAYMNGDFETPDLKLILDVYLDNRHTMEPMTSLPHRMFTICSALYSRFLGHTLSQSVNSVTTGYDVSNDFFKIFLSEEMMYSGAFWPDELGGVRGDLDGESPANSLERAQIYKIQYILRKARIKPGARLLELGSGWGGLAIEAAKAGCTVDTITLSVQQKILAEERIIAEGLQDKIRVHLLDYRSLPPEFENAFDACVSIEMVEAVGLKYLPQYFKVIDWALKPDSGVVVIGSTTQPESRYTTVQATDYARKYQWPNSFLPSATSFISLVQEAIPGRLCVETVADYGHHYPRTLREWNRRLQMNWGPEVEEKLIKCHPHLANGNNLEIFKRKWEYMYVYAEVGYARAYSSLHYFTFTRPENVQARCD